MKTKCKSKRRSIITDANDRIFVKQPKKKSYKKEDSSSYEEGANLCKNILNNRSTLEKLFSNDYYEEAFFNF